MTIIQNIAFAVFALSLITTNAIANNCPPGCATVTITFGNAIPMFQAAVDSD